MDNLVLFLISVGSFWVCLHLVWHWVSSFLSLHLEPWGKTLDMNEAILDPPEEHKHELENKQPHLMPVESKSDGLTIIPDLVFKWLCCTPLILESLVTPPQTIRTVSPLYPLGSHQWGMKCEQVTQALGCIPEAGDWLGNQAESMNEED